MAAPPLRRALLVLPQEGFDDEAYRHTRAYLGTRRVLVQVAAPTVATAKGARVDETAPDLALEAVDPSSYDALVVIGGPGTDALQSDAGARRVIQAVSEKGGVLAATGSGALALGQAGVLRGRRVTGNARDRGALAASGARWVGGEVVVDARVVTGRDGSALRFAERVGRLLGF